MEIKKWDQWAVALTATLLTTVVGLPQARGELVYEESAPAEAPAPRVDDRVALRQALSSSERARATRDAESEQGVAQQPLAQQPAALQQPLAQQPVYQQPAAQQPVAQQPALQQQVIQQPALEAGSVQKVIVQNGDGADDMRNMNKSELIRRQRVREELRNEDSLQERLEELRLRDERRRTDQILGASPGAGEAAGTAAGQLGQPAGSSSVSMPSQLYSGGIQEQVVSGQSLPQAQSPAPAQTPASRLNAQQAPAQGNAAQQSPAPGVQLAGVNSVTNYDQAGYNQSSMNASLSQENAEKSSFYIQGRVGMGSMTGVSGYDIHPRVAAGVGVGMDTSEYLSLEAGYTYAEYGVGINSANPFVQQLVMMQTMGGNSNFDMLVMKQNVIDAGLKVHLLDSSSKFRPFVGGGGGYSTSYINYNSSILSAMGQNNMGGDYHLTQYLGYLSTGADVKVSKGISVGLTFKYYAVLSSQQNNPLNNYGFMGQPYYGMNGAMDPAKQYVGGSVANSSFYSLMGGVTFTF